MYCAVCGSPGEILLCDNSDCNKYVPIDLFLKDFWEYDTLFCFLRQYIYVLKISWNTNLLLSAYPHTVYFTEYIVLAV